MTLNNPNDDDDYKIQTKLLYIQECLVNVWKIQLNVGLAVEIMYT